MNEVIERMIKSFANKKTIDHCKELWGTDNIKTILKRNYTDTGCSYNGCGWDCRSDFVKVHCKGDEIFIGWDWIAKKVSETLYGKFVLEVEQLQRKAEQLSLF